MLYYIEGTVAELGPEMAVIDCGGVGFEVSVTPNTVSGLCVGERARIYVTESIGEDHYDLFGFLSVNEKKWFKMLTSVSGVGPKAAMSVLSYNSADSIASAVISGDEKAFTACPGIGKKIAQRIILELKDKISKSFSASDRIQIPAAGAPKTAGHSTAYEEALTALSVLGYSTADVIPVLRTIDTEGMSTQEIIRSVLKYMV